MPKQTLEIEVPEGFELTGEYRAPQPGEIFVNANGNIVKAKECPSHPRPIVRKAWQWPEWLTADWIAMEETGDWYAYREEPMLCEAEGYWLDDDDDEDGDSYTYLSPELLTSSAFPPCPRDDWTKSKHRNPRTANS